MGYFTISVAAPHATPYDASYPTRSTENYAHALHEILQDMEDVGFNINDGRIDVSASRQAYLEWITDNIEVVFDYAASAIEEHRTPTPITLSKPLWDDLTEPYWAAYPQYTESQWRIYTKCMEMMWKVYYMWKTEDDPLLIKEKLQELLIAWPLTDTEIVLNEEGGQSMHIVPAWKNVDL